MKTIKLLIITILLIVSNASFAQTTTSKESKKQTKEVTFLVHIDCEGCVNKIKKNIPYEKGVKNLKVHADKQIVWILYNPKKTDVNKLLDAFKKIGEEAKVLE